MNQRISYLLFLFSASVIKCAQFLVAISLSLFSDCLFEGRTYVTLYPWFSLDLSLSQLFPLPELNASFSFSHSGEVLFKDLLLFVSIPVSVLSSSSLTGPPHSSFVRYPNSPPALKQTKQTQNTSGLKEALYT